MKANVKNLRVVKPGVAIHLFVSLVTVGFCFAACAADARVIVDSAGRRVEVPAKIERVFAAGAPAGVFIYTLAPEKLLNWNLPLAPEQRAYMPTRYAELPALGRLTGRGNTASVETVLAARPDVIFDYGTINPTYLSLADRAQKQTGVPYLLFDGTFDQVARIYKSAGAALGVSERAADLSRYAERLLTDVDKRLARVPPEKRPLVYYARGPRGLQTGLKGSINVESIERIGARNVAGERIGQGSLVTVSPEQLLMWNPEIVITAEASFAAIVATDDVWKSIKAVRSGRVYVAPTLPFPWIDSPPSVNRLIGLKWLGGIFYPQVFPENLRTETHIFTVFSIIVLRTNGSLTNCLEARCTCGSEPCGQPISQCKENHPARQRHSENRQLGCAPVRHPAALAGISRLI